MSKSNAQVEAHRARDEADLILRTEGKGPWNPSEFLWMVNDLLLENRVGQKWGPFPISVKADCIRWLGAEQLRCAGIVTPELPHRDEYGIH